MGYSARYSTTNPYNGGVGSLEMDPTTKRLFFKRRTFKYKPEARVDFIAKNKRRIKELCNDISMSKPLVSAELPMLLTKICDDIDEAEVDKLLAYTDQSIINTDIIVALD